ncbi:MAG: hypothetical protein H6704_09605 [Myxococcales bacterium]|nr:hypothetical protein [Myxococcales bacterium]
MKACDKLDMGLQARVYAAEQGADTSELVQAAVRALDDPTLRALAAG